MIPLLKILYVCWSKETYTRKRGLLLLKTITKLQFVLKEQHKRDSIDKWQTL